MSKTIKETVQTAGARQVLKYLDSDPDTNVPKILDWIEKFDRDGVISSQLQTVRRVLSDKDNNWYQLIVKLYDDIDPDVRKKIFENFLLNSVVIGLQRQRQSREEHDCNIPWAILMDPTSACNLKCTGCWAADYGNRMNMDMETWDSIITQGKELGTYMYIYSGGEPMVRKDDIIRMCEKHDDCTFLAFTNGTLIDEAFADDMLRVRNFIPAISIEGDEETTDARRGTGTYKKVIRAMNILQDKKLPFGISCCYTSQNAEVIGSEAYFDDMISKGALFAWIFTYMPIGKDAPTDLLATAEQREYMYRQVRNFRETKPIFTMDFWNDGEYVDGCIAGGRHYLHINARGDIEPCAFIHYSDTNIHDSTLLDAYKNPLFMQYRQNQPFDENLLKPCPLLDNPGRLADMVDKSGARSSDFVDGEDVHELSEKFVETAEKWEPTAERLWDETVERRAKAKVRDAEYAVSRSRSK